MDTQLQNKPSGIDISSILRAALQHWVGILLIMAVGALAGFGYTLTQTKVYAAEASGFVSTGVSKDPGLASVADNFAKSRAKSYLDVATSRATAERVVTALGKDGSAADLATQISVTVPTNTVLLKITARAGSAAEAQTLADAWIVALAAQVQEVESAGGTPTETGENSPENTPLVSVIPLAAAELPSAPISPNVPLSIAVGLALGLALAIGYALTRQHMDRRIRSAETIEKKFGLSVVGAIPAESDLEDQHRLMLSAHFDTRRGTKGGRIVGEAFRSLRTNLQYMSIDDPPRIFVVSSSRPGEGKSTVAANLAVTMARSGQRVVLVDGDLRRPTVATTFDMVSGVGLTDILVGRAEIDDVLQPWGADDNLSILGAGQTPPNPSELLGSRTMKSLLAELAKSAVVIIDAPPLLPVTDAAILTTHADGALLVVSAGKSTTVELEQSLANLSLVSAKVLGVVVNRAPLKGSLATRYGYYGDDYESRNETPSTPTTQPDSRSPQTLRTPTPAPHWLKEGSKK